MSKEVENADVTLTIRRWDRDDLTKIYADHFSGKYTGGMKDGLPSGKGRFDADDDGGEPWYYEGYFKEGMFDGQGKAIWSTQNYQEVGRYEEGLFSPSVPQTYSYIIRASSVHGFSEAVDLSGESITFISQNSDLFPATTEEAKGTAQSLVDGTIEYKHLDKSLQTYKSSLMYFDNQFVVSVGEYNRIGHTFTEIIASAPNGKDVHYIFFDGSTDIYKGDSISFISLPVASVSYDNTGGGTTHAVASIASTIKVS